MGAAGREVVADDGAWATGELGNAIGRWPLPSAESSPGADEVGLWCSAPCSVRGRCCNWSVPLAGGVACPTRAFLNMMNAPRGPAGRGEYTTHAEQGSGAAGNCSESRSSSLQCTTPHEPARKSHRIPLQSCRPDPRSAFMNYITMCRSRLGHWNARGG